MRDIRFRAKRTDNGEWVEGGGILLTYENNGTPKEEVYIIKSDSEFMCRTDEFGNIVAIRDAMFCAVDPDTVCEWTGQTDKNGKKIFEDDIVLVNGKHVDHVIFSNGCFCMENQIMQYEFTYQDQATIEVIGNIYDNPNLIKW